MVNVNAGNLQGDAHVLVIGSVVVMIDAGYASEARSRLIPYLRSRGIRKVDHFFVSHPHRDHYEGLKELIEDGVRIQKLYYKVPDGTVSDPFYDRAHFASHMAFAKSMGAKVFHPKTGFRLSLPNGSYIDLIHAQEGNLPGKSVDVNDLSLIMRWRVAAWTVLFTGDLNQTVGQWLADNRDVSADVLKVPHHGGRSIAPVAFFNAVDPDYAAVPSPQWVWCGDRGDIARQWIGERKIPTWINGIDGHIVFKFDGIQMKVHAQKPQNMCKAVFVPNGVFNKTAVIIPSIELVLGDQ